MSDDLVDALRREMARAGLTSRALSQKAGLNDTAVRDIINGRSKVPRLSTIARLAKTLGIQMHELVSAEHIMQMSHEILAGEEFQHVINNLKDKEGSETPSKGRKIYGGDFRAKNMSGADLSDAIFAAVDLRGADLSGANLIRTDFTGADLRGANLSNTLVDQTIFVDADLGGANLAGVDMSKAIFHRDAKSGG
jgi:transcriptional regulator with XRE-family HTH domain